MILSGLLVLLFVIIHVKQFKFGTLYLSTVSDAVRDLYRTEMEVFSMRRGWRFYVIATLLVGLHLRHGISSAFQSIGFDHPLYTRRLTAMGIALAMLIGGGLALIPVLVHRLRSG